MPVSGVGISKSQVDATIAGLVSDDTPTQIMPSGDKGSSTKVPRSDHSHAARVQRIIKELAADGSATWMFGRPFENEPSLQYMVFQSTGAPIVVEGASWVREVMNPAPSGKYIGVVVKGYRSRSLPALAAVSGLLTAVITGINTVTTALSGFDMFAGGNLAGIRVHLSAGDQM